MFSMVINLESMFNKGVILVLSFFIQCLFMWSGELYLGTLCRTQNIGVTKVGSPG